MSDETNDDALTVIVTLNGEDMEFGREVSETASVEAMDVAVHGGSRTIAGKEDESAGARPTSHRPQLPSTFVGDLPQVSAFLYNFLNW
ncbi:hypothetical protein [Natronococcus jeotgali]|uniref:Uncharacterized protein n=1 Tax=Natronococcus jeotgali DSM 18795 TaxID=1227498 RepID=L9XPL3_9EURY|nr:hypothetical protein [Natronococcus jeotgali]ELY62523.1 hypothetical protein C492_08005 [Natronococcus jeotgali DSM 18795]